MRNRQWLRAAVVAVVQVTGGQIAGTELDNHIAVFKGIPYAQPPIGPLRWQEPQPVKHWTGVRDATQFSAVCPQGPALAPKGAPMSEDCLYLNIWAPDWPSRKPKAVMVWITGGGNFGGGIATTKSDGDGAALAGHGVVVVSFNYRLGTLGFFSHPALTRESPHHASGNQGILDQIAVLTWVKNNIARFGGDPDNVTLFGESAGAHDASALMTTPLSKGLFKRVIAESGSVVLGRNPQNLTEAQARDSALAARWGLSESASAQDLRAIPVANILKNDPDLILQHAAPAEYFPNLGLVVNGYVFPESPIKVFMTGHEHPADLLHGSNSRDGIPGPTYDGPSDLDAAIGAEYGPLAERAKQLYRAPADPLYGTQSNQWAEDTSFRCPAAAQVSWHSNAGHRAWQYEFSYVPVAWRKPSTAHPPDPELPVAGAYHASEIAFVFGSVAAADRDVSQAIQQYWTHFAKTGDPNGGTLPDWPKFDASSRSYLQFANSGPHAARALRQPQCDLFIENVKRLTP